MRHIMDRFKARDYELLVKLFKRDANKRVLEEYDRDYPSKFLLKLLFQEPRLALFGRVLLQRSTVGKVFRAG